VRCHLGSDAPELEFRAARDALAQGPPEFDDTPRARFGALVRRKDDLLARLGDADHVFAPSRFLAGMFVRNGFPAERIEVLPYGLDPDRVRRLPVARPRTPLRVGFIGVLSPWKAPHLLIDAVRARQELAVDVVLHGDLGMQDFAEYVAELRRRAGDDPRIRFAGSFAGERLDDVLGAIDLLVVPSIWYENTPFVILEAFAAGVPVAASALGGLAELVVDGRNGWLFPAGDAAALGRLLERCVADPAAFAALEVAPPPSIAANYDRFRAVYAGDRG
jgi:glycosyltransferase involved in cell wall biosynthesis